MGDLGRCGVCGSEIAEDFFEPPTFTNEEVGPGVVRPVLSKPMRIDPETGAICWCAAPNAAVDPEEIPNG
jgi:hypothetical protein